MNAHFQNYRKVGHRLVLTGLLELASPCHLGGADADATSDQPLLRDSEGRPYLPGTTLTGLLRSLLERTNAVTAEALFGAVWGDPEGKQARLLLSDARIAQAGPVPTELRDGVAIDCRTGVAAENKKYDLELLPAGVRFSLIGQLELYGETVKDQPLLRGMLILLRALEDSQLALGARSRRGFGETRMVADEEEHYWQVEDYDLTQPQHLYAWLGREMIAELPVNWPQIKPVAYRNAETLAQHWKVDLPVASESKSFTVTVQLAVSGSLLVGSEGHDPKQPDRSHLQRLNWQGNTSTLESVLPATSLAGVLRHRCLRIAQTLAAPAGKQDKAVELIANLFGPADIRSKQNQARASRVAIQEAVVENGQLLRHTRVRIDPWTGGAVESLLFTEDALYGGRVKFRLSLQTDAGEWLAPACALLLLALRDLANGDLNIGAEGGVGRGRWCPLPDQPFATVNTPAVELYLQNDGTARCEPADALTSDFEALRDYFGGGNEE